MASKTLAHCCIFYLEDEYLVAEETREVLADAGADVVVRGSVARSLDLIDKLDPDLALLDINVAGTSSLALARSLKLKNVPILFLTSYDKGILPEDLASCSLLTKPIGGHRLICEIENVLHANTADSQSFDRDEEE